MKYIEKYKLYIDNDFVVYRYNENTDKFKQIKIQTNRDGYLVIQLNGTKLLHRVIWETFKYEIPKGYQIDHINTIRTDNRLENLRCVTGKENQNNPLTRKHLRESHKGQINRGTTRGKIWSEFGEKFKEHFVITRSDNPNLYDKERMWYHRHNKTCRWEI